MADAQPIDPARFAQALEDLPVDALYSKVSELSNSIEHLRSSNQQMLPFAEEGDQDCKDAMFENLGVIGRMNERIQLIKAEVQRRGLRWTEGELENAAAGKEAPDMVNGDGHLVNGVGTSQRRPPRHVQSAMLSDEELMRRMQERMENDDDGVHL